MTIGIILTDDKHQYLQTAYARHMGTALSDAIGDAMYLCTAQRPIVYMRDCLGGLRAEARWNAKTETVTIKRTK